MSRSNHRAPWARTVEEVLAEHKVTPVTRDFYL